MEEIKKKTLIFIISLVISLLIFELFLSLFFPQKLYNECFNNQHPDAGGAVIEQNDTYGWINKKDYHVCRYQPDSNKKLDIHHNSKGIRSNYEHSYEKPKGIKRVLLLGDSNTYGFGLAQNETESYLLQEKLGEEFEVINFGVIGYGLDQSLLLFLEEGSKYQPDIVVLNIHSNDFSDSIQNTGLDNMEKPILRFDISGYESYERFAFYNFTSRNFMKENPFNDKPIRRFFRSNFHSYTFFSDRLNNMKDTKEFKKSEKKIFYDLDTLMFLKNSAFMLVKDVNRTFQKIPTKTYIELLNSSTRRTGNFIGLFYVLSKDMGFSLIITYTPSKKEVYEKEQKLFVSQFSDVTMEDFYFENINNLLHRITNEGNIMFISYFDIAEENEDFYFETDGHKSPEGVEITSEQILSKIKDLESKKANK